MSFETIQSYQAATSAATGGEKQHDPHLLNVQEVGALLQVPTSWVYERTRRLGDEQLPHLKLGKYLRFEESAVVAFVRRQRRA